MESNITKDKFRDASEVNDNLGWFIGLGIGLIILGWLAIFVPFASTFAIETFVGILFAVGGIMHIIHAFRWKTSGRFVSDLFLGIIYLISGLWLLAYPLTGVFTLTFVLSILFFIEGIFKIIQSARTRNSSGWVWMIFSGTVSVILALIIWAGFPLTAFWTIGLLVGIDLIFNGWSVVMIALAARASFRQGQRFCIGGECFQA